MVKLRLILYLEYLCPCLALGLFMLYLYDLFFIFSLIFIVVNHITSSNQMYLFFVHFLEYFLLILDDNVDKVTKVLLIKKRVFAYNELYIHEEYPLQLPFMCYSV